MKELEAFPALIFMGIPFFFLKGGKARLGQLYCAGMCTLSVWQFPGVPS